MRLRSRATATAQQIARNLGEQMRASPETAGIASGVLVGGAMASQVFAPELAVARLVSTARWLNMGRVAMLAGRMPSGVRAVSGVARAGVVFGRRAVTDGAIQFGGGLLAHGGNAEEAYNEINTTSMFMAGLPGDKFWHSVRNNAISAAYEIKLNRREGVTFAPMALTWQGGLNFGQKVALGVGADYIVGTLSSSIRPYQLNAHSVLARSANPHYRWLYLQRLMLLTGLDYGSTGFKVMGEGVSNIVEE